MSWCGLEGLRERRVGVSLSSGYFGYFAHCGFARAAAALGISPVAISGCSAGAIVGALWASGLGPDAMRDVVLGAGVRALFDLPDAGQVLRAPFGFLGGRRFEALLERALPVSTFEDCPTPFAVTAFDLDVGTPRVIDSGPLARGVRASASLPGLLCPTALGGHLLWDGGLAEKAPVRALARRGDLDVILVCYLPRPRCDGPPRTIVSGLRRAIDFLVFESDRRAVEETRAAGIEVVVVCPDVPRCGPHRLGLGPQIIAIAEADATRRLLEGDLGSTELS
jgi:NTE family protein